jgi:sugar phosphate isomerase/epimerase
MTTTTELGDWGLYASTDAWRAQINALLADTGIELHGRHWYGTYPARPDAADLIRQAIQDSDIASAVESVDGGGA